ncbi:MAG: response regulator [Clostridiales bacterium]|nr:response regulator [Clostridiales bacterium]
MKNSNYSFMRFFLSDDITFEERIFNFVATLGAFATAIALAARIVEGMPLVTLGAVVIMFSIILMAFLISAKRLKFIKAFTAVAVLGIGAVLFPLIFFTNGGSDSGMAAYFTLSIMLEFLLLHGKTRAISLILTSAIIIFSYYSTIFWDFPILPEGGLNDVQRFVDNMQSIFVAGLFMGFVIVFQNNVYLKEKRMAESRLAGQQLMSGISRSFISKEPVGDLIQAALARLGAFMKVERVIVYVLDNEANLCRPAYSYPEYTLRPQLRWFGGKVKDMFPRSLGKGEEVLNIHCDNTRLHEHGKYKHFYDSAGLKSFICSPVYIDGELWGVISIEDSKSFHVWSESDARLADTVSSSISSAVARDLMEKERAAALEQAITASRAKGDFLSNMSHEMRTPMNAIIGMTSIGKSSRSEEKKDYAFDKIEDASKHLLGIINDILDMSKIEANKLELSPVSFDFELMLKNVVNIINLRVEERHQKFYVDIGQDIPAMLVGDDQRLAQVIANLLSNSVKFTPDGGVIRLSAKLLPAEEGMCRLQIDVADTGIGITGEQKARLFQSFEQAEAGTARKFGGTGLGLAISKSIVELMGGEMWVESEPGSGTKVSFTALLERGAREQPHLLAKDVNWDNIRIFAVDDDPEIRSFFINMAGNLRISCEVAASGEEALEKLEEDDGYDVYFFDLRLPGMSGIELARRINEKHEGKPVVILFSAMDRSDVEGEARAAGVDKFISKPLFQSYIVDVINACFNYEDMYSPEESVWEDEDFSGHIILLAEDVDVNREIVMTLLEPTGLTIDCADNGAQAFRMFKEEPDKYDLILMDIQMPEMDGYEATRRIRALDMRQAKEIPVIAMTANVFREDVERCLDAGMNAHVGKPLDFDEVLNILRMYLHW